MTSTPRERVWSAIRQVEPDRVPYHLSFTVPAWKKLEAHFGSPDLDQILDNHLAKYKPHAPDAWQEVCPDIRDEVLRLIDRVGRGGGFIIAPSHDMPGDIPLENMLALIEAVRTQ